MQFCQLESSRTEDVNLTRCARFGDCPKILDEVFLSHFYSLVFNCQYIPLLVQFDLLVDQNYHSFLLQISDWHEPPRLGFPHIFRHF